MPIRTRSWLGALLGLAIATSGLGLAIAQKDGGKAPVDLNLRPPKDLTAAEQEAEAEAIVKNGKKVESDIQKLLKDARKKKDIILVTCLNDKLIQVKANLKTAENRTTALTQATDKEGREHEFTVLLVLGQKLSALEQEGHECIGQDIYETGDSAVDVTIDADLDDDPTHGLPPVTIEPPPVTIEPPPIASPFT